MISPKRDSPAHRPRQARIDDTLSYTMYNRRPDGKEVKGVEISSRPEDRRQRRRHP